MEAEYNVKHDMNVPYECICGLLPTPTLSVGVGRIFESVCLSVCPQHNSKTNDPMFKLGVGNDLGIY